MRTPIRFPTHAESTVAALEFTETAAYKRSVLSPLRRLQVPPPNMPDFDSGSGGPRIPGWKRAIDLLCCLMALPLLAACALIGATIMRLTSPGPLLFRQERVGHRGERFSLFKFRTMHVSASTDTHHNHFAELIKSNAPMKKLDAKGDCRLIKGAEFMRASGLDELPQIVNVLRGEMSIVGPRPCIPYEYEMYTPDQRRRLDAVPGLTGLWQVSGKNGTTFAEMVELDIEYARRMSLWLDLKILLLTPTVLVEQLLDTRMRRKTVEVSENSGRQVIAYTETPFKPKEELQRSS